MVDLGSRTPKPPENAYKTRENITTPQLASLHGLASNWAKNRGKKAKRTNGTYFAGPHPHPQDFHQRAENRALDPWSLHLRFGVPRFSVQRPRNPYSKEFQSDLGQESGTPQMQIQRPRMQRPILSPLISFLCAFPIGGLF